MLHDIAILKMIGYLTIETYYLASEHFLLISYFTIQVHIIMLMLSS